MTSQSRISKAELKAFVQSEEWRAEVARLEAARPRCVAILTKTFCCEKLLAVKLEGDVLERWLNTNYFYLSGYCTDCSSTALKAQWSITHYDDAHIIWNGHGLKAPLDEDAETLLH